MSEATPESDAGESAPCPACIVSAGLCVRHAKQILPQLAQPFWYRLVGTHYQKPPVESPRAKRVRERKERKRAERIQALMSGKFSPARCRTAAA